MTDSVVVEVSNAVLKDLTAMNVQTDIHEMMSLVTIDRIKSTTVLPIENIARIEISNLLESIEITSIVNPETTHARSTEDKMDESITATRTEEKSVATIEGMIVVIIVMLAMTVLVIENDLIVDANLTDRLGCNRGRSLPRIG